MRTLTIILATLVAAPLLSQEPRATPEMQRLSRLFLGRWSTDEKHEPGDIAPKGGIGRGSEEDHWCPGRMSLIADYKASDPAGEFLAHTMMWWDAKEQAYRSVACHNRSPACGQGLWRWKGSELVSRKGGIRMVWTDLTPASHTFYMEAPTKGGAMKHYSAS